ncbi:MAG: hypothetical protein KDI01_04780 [Halioglobus sp.]|nr:hypothetical protein [Halioglobus sp.]
MAQTELDKARTRQEVTAHQIEQVRARIADNWMHKCHELRTSSLFGVCAPLANC